MRRVRRDRRDRWTTKSPRRRLSKSEEKWCDRALLRLCAFLGRRWRPGAGLAELDPRKTAR
jgi:hypothetical protein